MGLVDSGSFRPGETSCSTVSYWPSADFLLEAKAIPLTVPDTMDLSMDIESSLGIRPVFRRPAGDVVLLEGLVLQGQ